MLEFDVFVLVLNTPSSITASSMKFVSSKSFNGFLNKLAVILNLSAPGAE